MKRLLLILGLFSIFTATSFGQSSIAAVARKERERQKSSQSKIVVTANTTTTAAAAAPKLPAPDAAATSSAAKATGPTDNKGRDEKYWRAAFDQARDNLKRAEQRVELLDLRIKDLNKQMLQLSSFYNREYRMGPELTTAQSELEAAKKDADQARQKLSDLEDELRRSGGPAGWAR
jgi:chromosome segregation ATPase